MTEYIYAGDIPKDILNSIGETIRFYTVAFADFVKRDDGTVAPQLLGTGTLVSAGGVRAIMTAAHVIDILPMNGRIGVFLTPESAPESIDVGGVARVSLPRGESESAGPDLGALILAPSIASTLAAKKLFFNLDSARARILAATPDVRSGIWVAQGFLDEETRVERDGRVVHAYLYNFSAVGGPDEVVAAGAHDYVDFLVSHDARDSSPERWGGMSGGGLWQVPLSRAAAITHGTPTLAGVLFYQHPTSATTSGVRGHVWRSVYDILYGEISGKT